MGDIWRRKWFAKGEQQKVTDEFLQMYAGQVSRFISSEPEKLWEKMALIVLFDQIPRNVFRGQPDAYAFDKRAFPLAWALFSRIDELPVHFKVTVIVALCHTESVEVQNEVSKYVKERFCPLYDSTHPELVASLQRISCNHRERVVLFGRIPERNEILGRKSTEAETAFLAAVKHR
uniref:DUF924 domain-containing protein n=1 Tax=Chromera velia CCMP2878 TaxID=1169474 RepID=A0A0G4I0G2_9ALVE|eukprot:Cvel_9923.t1-p1 / transcript=Cvel_9923.t1 / gene=Cvel_9923 / organism=Chromera_velia_CCMP2878 / gene_product=hypothetical protein / transcript_product=hypothetical protein / location=Cvel_scaffold586:33002-33526(-) / protein_length=175 / sequence_SO=supercontig / SO=protein_coding / is_pseudo=false